MTGMRLLNCAQLLIVASSASLACRRASQAGTGDTWFNVQSLSDCTFLELAYRARASALAVRRLPPSTAHPCPVRSSKSIEWKQAFEVTSFALFCTRLRSGSCIKVFVYQSDKFVLTCAKTRHSVSFDANRCRPFLWDEL